MTPNELVIKNLNTEYNVGKLIRIFLIMLEVRKNLSYAAIHLVRTHIMARVEHNHSVGKMMEILRLMCEEYQFDYNIMVTAYNRLLEECIDQALTDIRKQVRCELGR